MLKVHNPNLRWKKPPTDKERRRFLSRRCSSCFDCSSSGDFPLLQQEIKELVIMEDNYISLSVCLCCCSSLVYPLVLPNTGWMQVSHKLQHSGPLHLQWEERQAASGVGAVMERRASLAHIWRRQRKGYRIRRSSKPTLTCRQVRKNKYTQIQRGGSGGWVLWVELEDKVVSEDQMWRHHVMMGHYRVQI